MDPGLNMGTPDPPGPLGVGGSGPPPLVPTHLWFQQEAMPQRVDIVPEEGANLHIFGLAPTVTDLTQAWARSKAVGAVSFSGLCIL